MTQLGQNELDRPHDEALQFARIVGRRIVDLAGNSRQTKAQKLRSLVGLQRKAQLSVYGSVFASKLPGAGTLIATILDVTDKGNPNLQGPMVQIQTVSETNNPHPEGRQPQFYICPTLFDLMPEESWLKHRPASIAEKLLQIGEHLMSAKVSRGSKIDRLVGPPDMLLIRNDEFDRLFRLLLQSALVASGHDDENKFLAYKPRTPTQRATILPLGFSGDVSPALRAVIDCADNAQVLISRHEEAVVVRPNEMFLTARGMTIVDRMKSIRHATELLAQCGLSADDLQMTTDLVI